MRGSPSKFAYEGGSRRKCRGRPGEEREETEAGRREERTGRRRMMMGMPPHRLRRREPPACQRQHDRALPPPAAGRGGRGAPRTGEETPPRGADPPGRQHLRPSPRHPPRKAQRECQGRAARLLRGQGEQPLPTAAGAAQPALSSAPHPGLTHPAINTGT